MPLKVQQDDEPTINLTSMIDVLFLLIIFFMVGTRFDDAERQIDLNLPRVAGAAPMIAGPQSRVVSLSRDGSVMLDGRRMSTAELTATLRAAVAEYRDTAVDVRSDGASTAQQLADVFAAIQNAGVNKLGFRTAGATGGKLVR